jgi:pimeloyl-ACP methyl ester carboxylesterase
MLKGVIISVLVLGTAVSVGVFMMPAGERKVLDRLAEIGVIPDELIVDFQEQYVVRAMVFGDSTKPKLVFVHGSPGDWSNWELIISDPMVRAQYCLVAVDRAGYGQTTVPPRASLTDQSEVIWRVLDTWLPTQGAIIVGHSYGGAVVEEMLLERPGYFHKAILAAPTLGPDMQAPRWYNNFAELSLVNAMLPQGMKSSNLEMMALPRELNQNEPRLKTIKSQIIYIQGGKDVLVPYETADYFAVYGPEHTEFIFEEKMNHFIPWSDPDLIISAILD